METSNEELKSSNEEMQSVNEELQSTNEELETSKEELQSVNEELATVNVELQQKVADLSRANNDMNNLLAGTGIGTVFVDHQLRIQRFTPAVTQVINLILTDVGRPVGHIVSNLAGYDRLVEDVKAVLDTLVPKEIEVQTKAGAWYLLRIRPYRTLENVIEGAVITFTEITEMRNAQAALRESEALRRLAVVVRDAHDAVLMQDLEGRILAWNPGAERMYGWSEAEALTMNIRDLIPEGQREDALAIVKQLARAEVLEPYRLQRIAKDGRIVEVWLTATALMNETGEVYAIATTERERRGQNQDGGSSSQGRSKTMTDKQFHLSDDFADLRRRAEEKATPTRSRPRKRCRPRKPDACSTSCRCIRSSWRCRTRNCAGHRVNSKPRGRGTSTCTIWRRWAISPSANRG